MNVQAGKRSGGIGRGKVKMTNGRNDEGNQGQEWTDVDGHADNPPEAKKKGVKCLVM